MKRDIDIRSNGMTRRQFLISSAAGTATLAFSESYGIGRQVTNLLDEGSPLQIPPNFRPSIWFTLEANGVTTVHVFKAELGQHIGTCLAQIVAEELELDWRDVRIDYPEMTSESQARYGIQMTGGSYSTHEMFDRLARSGAAARQLLLEVGADLLGSDTADCIVRKSRVVDVVMGADISFSDILSQTAIEHVISEKDLAEVKLKNRRDYKIVGRSLPALDAPEKVNGKARFGIDAYAPNMVYGKVIPPPVRMWSKVRSIDDSKAKSIAGYITTLPLNLPDALGYLAESTALVVAESFPAAMRAARVIEVDWDTQGKPAVSSAQMESHARQLQSDPSQGVIFVADGDIATAKASAKESVSAEYVTEMVTHATMEPHSALAQEVDGRWHIYAGHQAGNVVRYFVSQVMQVAPKQVIFHPHHLGGGFGAKVEIQTPLVAVMAASALKRPVKVIMTREDDTAMAHPRSPTVQHLKGYVGAAGNLQGMEHDVVAGWVGARFGSMFLVDGAEGEGKVDIWSNTGADHWYDIPNQRVRAIQNQVVQNAFPVGAVRSVANNYTVFALESFLDEVARQVEVDPLEFRLRHLTGQGKNAGASPEDKARHSVPVFFGIPDDAWKQWKFRPTYHPSGDVGGAKRLANVLHIASGLSGYRALGSSEDAGFGIAVSAAEERAMPSFCACVAQVRVDRNTGKPSVDRLTVAIDVGVAVNPDGILAQVESSVLWGLSGALHERLSAKEGQLQERNFDQYKWQTIKNLPELRIEIVQGGLYPCGVGEPATSVVGPAIANAIHDAVGVRVRHLPITAAAIREELKQA